MQVYRLTSNPIIRPEDIKPSREDFEVICSFNPGVAKLGDETILLVRVAERPKNDNHQVYLAPVFDAGRKELVTLSFEKGKPDYNFSDSRVISSPTHKYLTSISHFRVARSKDGVNFSVDQVPSMFPETAYEEFGIEDARITCIDGIYHITYSAISQLGITTCLATTQDFKSFERKGIIFHPDNKDVEIFPEKINGKYYALHRPSASHFGRPEVWIAESPNLICWGNHRHLMGTRAGYWDNGRIGGSAVPFRVKEGWLEIYHGATKDDRYCLGGVLLDADEPWKIIARSEKPILEPIADYEINGFFGNVIFNCGVLNEGDNVKIYYGAADTYTCYAELSLSEILKNLI